MNKRLGVSLAIALGLFVGGTVTLHGQVNRTVPTGFTILQAFTEGGASAFKRVSTADTNAAVIKDAAGQLCFAHASNVNAAVRYLKLYNTASAPTVGTTVPTFTIAIPGATTGGATAIIQPAVCIAFSTGISMALTTEATDAGSTGVAASELVVNIGYK